MNPSPSAQATPKLPCFEQRVASARAELAAYAHKLLPPGSPSASPHLDHEDLVQDTMARALNFRASYDEARPLVPWLKRMLLRVFLDHRKRRLAAPDFTPDYSRKTATASGPSTVDELPAPGSDAAHPGRVLEATEEVLRLLALLDEPERGILDRFHRCGESVASIGRALGLPGGTVKSHLHRARQHLRERSAEGQARTTDQEQTPRDLGTNGGKP